MTITSSGSCFALHARRFFLVSTSKREVSKYLNTTRSTTAFRFHSSNISSSSSSSSSSVSTNKCPHSSGTNNNDNAAAKAAAIDAVKLVNVPKLPFLGSMIPQYSKTEIFDLTNSYNVWYKHWKKFGDFYNFGMPSLGKGITGEGKQQQQQQQGSEAKQASKKCFICSFLCTSYDKLTTAMSKRKLTIIFIINPRQNSLYIDRSQGIHEGFEKGGILSIRDY